MQSILNDLKKRFTITVSGEDSQSFVLATANDVPALILELRDHSGFAHLSFITVVDRLEDELLDGEVVARLEDELLDGV